MKYACCLMAVDPIFRFLPKKLSVLSALSHMLLMPLSHFKSLVRVTPRYFAEVTLDKLWPCSLYSVTGSFSW